MKAHRPDVIAVELSSSPQSAGAAFGFGVCVGILAQLDLPMVQVSQRKVKEAATGDVEADKTAMTTWAASRFPGAPWPTVKAQNVLGVQLPGGQWLKPLCEHMADAIAVGEAALRSDAIPGIVEGVRLLRFSFDGDRVDERRCRDDT